MNLMDARIAIAEIAEKASAGEIIFPSTTEMALKVQLVLDDPDCSVDMLVKLIQADPVLAARVVAIANSVVYNRSGQSITNVRSAVSRIGFSTLRVLAAAVVVRQMEGMAQTGAHRQMAMRLWEHTAHVAALSQVIARRVTHVNPDTAFFAGIVHEIGGFYLISCAREYPGLLEAEPGSLLAWDTGGAAEIGRAVLKRLNVPSEAMQAVDGLWQGYLALPPGTLSDTLLLADQLAPIESPLSKLAGKGSSGIEAQIEIELDDETLSSILEESESEVGSLIVALHS